MIAEFGDHPQARGHVARVMYKEGMYLRNSGRGEEAIQVWNELFSRFGTRPPSTAPSGQLARSQHLAEINRLNEAQAPARRC